MASLNNLFPCTYPGAKCTLPSEEKGDYFSFRGRADVFSCNRGVLRLSNDTAGHRIRIEASAPSAVPSGVEVELEVKGSALSSSFPRNFEASQGNGRAASKAGTKISSSDATASVSPNDSRESRKSRKNPFVLSGPSPPALTMMDYFDRTKEFTKQGYGPARWFCPLDAKPEPESTADSPLPKLFFIPGIEGTGMGLIFHHRPLSRLFEVSCLSVPLSDRSSFSDLQKVVEEGVLEEHRASPQRMLFIVAESFGALLAMAVAAKNPQLPLKLVLVNPATSFRRSQLRPLVPFLQLIPEEAYTALPVLLSTTLGNPLKLAQTGIPVDASPLDRLLGVREHLLEMLGTLPTVAELLPQATVAWKLQLLEQGVAAVEGELACIKAPCLILASEDDAMLPSVEEAQRLKKILPSAISRKFADSGHTLLFELEQDLATIIKGSGFYQKRPNRTGEIDNFVPPTPEEVKRARTSLDPIYRIASPVFFSTLENRRVVQGVAGIPDQRPLLFVGNHQTYAPDLSILLEGLMRQKGVLLRGLAHPLAMGRIPGSSATSSEPVLGDFFRVFGAVEVNAANLFRLLAKGEAALLFPGGMREGIKGRGEEYKLFWPERSEFVRMAAKHGATIIPFAAIGVDDAYQVVLDGKEITQLPFIGSDMTELSKRMPKVRLEGAAAEEFLPPVVVPKQLNRVYFLFQKPIPTRGRERELIDDKQVAQEVYMNVKKEVESGIDYLLCKRNDDPYGDFLPRLLYEASWGGEKQAPTFTP